MQLVYYYFADMYIIMYPCFAAFCVSVKYAVLTII